MRQDRLSQRQIDTLRQLSVVCSAGGQYALTRDQREAMQPLWRRGLIEIWYRQGVDTNPSLMGPFYRPTKSGWLLIAAIFAPRCAHAEAA
jgi:hypothetical protein